ncbi:hypothetical protein PENSPDRAFT_758064 [Peniophora sp. CONT]|nr:hypothetical protein PENSPDRAFT_758064 [Peniophora sp. CONT]
MAANTSSSSTLPVPKRIITTHDESGKSTVERIVPAQYQQYPHSHSSFTTLWNFDSVPTKDNNLQVDGGERKVTGPGLGVVQAGGVSVRYNDLAPGEGAPMHRTTSADVVVLISGQIILVLEDGSETLLEKPGDSIIQRGTAHAWRNASKTEWARFMGVIVDAEPVVVDGKALENEMRHG